MSDNNYYVFTDLETDDLVFIWCFIKKLKQDNKTCHIVFIVGEGNALIKYHRLEYYLNILEIPTTITYKILLSSSTQNDNKYDGVECLDSDLLAKLNSIDISVLNNELLNKPHKSSYFKYEDTYHVLYDMLDKETTGMFIIIKPLGYELNDRLITCVKNGDYIAHIYEGWNIKSTICKKNIYYHDVNKLVIQLLNSFQNTYMVANYKVLELNNYPKSISTRDYTKSTENTEIYENNIYNTSLRAVITKLKNSTHPFIIILRKYVLIWNIRMLRVLKREMSKYLTPESKDELVLLDTIDDIYQKNIEDISDADYNDAHILIKKLFSISHEKICLSIKSQMYLAIASCPRDQICIADYHIYNSIFNHDVYIWQKERVIVDRSESMTKGLLINTSENSDLTAYVTNATNLNNKNKSLSWIHFIRPLISSL